jgi:hypothetical protein
MDEKSPLLDVHETLPPDLKNLYKRYQRLRLEDLAFDTEVLDFSKFPIGDEIEILSPIPSFHLDTIFSRFVKVRENKLTKTQDAPVYGHKRLPGKILFSNACSINIIFPFP